jgi:hypothetical protein
MKNKGFCKRSRLWSFAASALSRRKQGFECRSE